jgi:hypothetical protein
MIRATVLSVPAGGIGTLEISIFRISSAAKAEITMQPTGAVWEDHFVMAGVNSADYPIGSAHAANNYPVRKVVILFVRFGPLEFLI